MQPYAQQSHACLLFDTLVVTAVTEASEMVSASGPPPMNMPWRSRFSVSRIAGSSRDHMKDTQGAKSTKIKALVLSIVLHHQSCLHIVFYCEIQAGILF